jgi:hypothetical protein
VSNRVGVPDGAISMFCLLDTTEALVSKRCKLHSSLNRCCFLIKQSACSEDLGLTVAIPSLFPRGASPYNFAKFCGCKLIELFDRRPRGSWRASSGWL